MRGDELRRMLSDANPWWAAAAAGWARKICRPICWRVAPAGTIESKWVDQGWRQEALVLEGRYGRGVMATQSILDLSHPSWAIPVPLLACLLG